jgi:hypothetical protein
MFKLPDIQEVLAPPLRPLPLHYHIRLDTNPKSGVNLLPALQHFKTS